jgi:membrane protein DedA with SNARE-associated domain
MVAGGLGMSYRQFVRYALPGTTLWAVFFGIVGVWSKVASDAVFDDSRSPLVVLLFGAPGFIAGWVMLVIMRRELAARRAHADTPTAVHAGQSHETAAVPG